MKKTAVFLFPLVCVCAIVRAGGSDPQTPPADATRRPAVVTDPQSNPSPPKAESDATADAPAATAAPAKPVKRIHLEDKTLTNEEVKQLFAMGYKPVGRNGEVYYCRREKATGSRVESMTCKTADQMKQLTRDSKDVLATEQRGTGQPTGH